MTNIRQTVDCCQIERIPVHINLLIEACNIMRFLYLIILSGILTECTESLIVHSWVARDVPVKKYNKILVIAILRDSNQDLRMNLENHMVGDLITKGFNAVSSYNELGTCSFEGWKEPDIIKR